VARAQRQAHEREAFYQISEQPPALIALLRAPAHRFEYVNPAYQDLFPGRQLVGFDAAEAVPELVPQGFVALLDSMYQTGGTYYGAELPFTWVSEGQSLRTYYLNFIYQACREAGEIVGVSIFAFEVTAPVLARQRQERERQELEQLFMQAPAPIVIFDGPDLVFQLVNPACQRIFPGREPLPKLLLETCRYPHSGLVPPGV
jgi:PAS domain-containing protein